jgi:hypothetical protein
MIGCGLSAMRTGPTATSFEHDGGVIFVTLMINPEGILPNDATKNKPDGLTEHATSSGLLRFRAYLRGVSAVSQAFPGAETGSSAYLCGKRLAVSAFPAFPGFGGGCIDD